MHEPLFQRAWPRAGVNRNSPAEVPEEGDFAARREAMVRKQILRRGVTDPRVLAAMRSVPRHEFVPIAGWEQAYDDRPLPIGFGQTISQPYIVAFMTEALRLHDRARVLEVGTGSGYQTAVLAEIAAEVYSVEIVPELAERAAGRLHLPNVILAARDGAEGWPEHAPYDGILCAAAAPLVPMAWLEQLAPGGRLVMPRGVREWQRLVLVTRERGRYREEDLMTVAFVPLTGRAGGLAGNAA